MNKKCGSDPEWLHVVAAVIENEKGQILIAKRPLHKHQGGLWEFPGGKVEQGEKVFTALQRELKEELTIEIHDAQNFLQIRHCYPDKNIFLDIYKVSNVAQTMYSGIARGNEGQEFRWITLDEMDNFEFPKANAKIVKALKAPEILSITSSSICDSDFGSAVLLSEKIPKNLEQLVNLSVDALLLRLPLLNDEQYYECALYFSELIDKLPQKNKIKLLVNRPQLLSDLKNIAGLHVSAKELMELKQRPVASTFLFSASCHNKAELIQAEKMTCDFVMLSPVFETTSHPQAKTLGWQGFKVLSENSELPILGLGGMQPENLWEAKYYGAIGVAGISNFGMST